MPRLEQLNCFNAKLVEPKQQVADKGLAAIRNYFQSAKKDDEDDPNRPEKQIDDKAADFSSDEDHFHDEVNNDEFV